MRTILFPSDRGFFDSHLTLIMESMRSM